MVAARQGITTIFDREHPRLEAGPYVIPLDVMAGSNDINTFDMELDASEEQIPTLAMSASSTEERWHQRLGRLWQNVRYPSENCWNRSQFRGIAACM